MQYSAIMNVKIGLSHVFLRRKQLPSPCEEARHIKLALDVQTRWLVRKKRTLPCIVSMQETSLRIHQSRVERMYFILAEILLDSLICILFNWNKLLRPGDDRMVCNKGALGPHICPRDTSLIPPTEGKKSSIQREPKTSQIIYHSRDQEHTYNSEEHGCKLEEKSLISDSH